MRASCLGGKASYSLISIVLTVAKVVVAIASPMLLRESDKLVSNQLYEINYRTTANFMSCVGTSKK